MDIFENCFFSNIKKGIKRKKCTAFSSENINFEKEINRNLLKFEALLQKDPKVKIVQMGDQYKVKLSKAHLAFNMADILLKSNPEVDLKFSEDLLEYNPDEDLMMKSKMPLWIIHPNGNNSVSIKRMW
jgi:hypothetical protein